MSQTEIKLVQKPVIQHALVEIGKGVTARLDKLNINNLIPSEDSVKALKALRTELTKELANYEIERKALKEAVANPYMEFEAVYKVEIQKKYEAAIETLKDKVAIVENKIKLEKKENVIRYFNELVVAENIDFLKFENVGLDINLSTSEKAYKDKCNEFITRVSDDILLINVQEHQAEIMAEYKKTLNASKAITTIVDRKASEKLEAEKIKLAETQRRQTLLRGLSMVYHDMTKTFNYVSDNNINIKMSDIENLSKVEFNKIYLELESKIKEIKQPEPVISSNNPVNGPAPSLFSQMTNGTAGNQTTASKQVAAPVEAPVVSAPKQSEESFSATFEVTGTMAQLMALKAYLIENNITYKNI